MQVKSVCEKQKKNLSPFRSATRWRRERKDKVSLDVTDSTLSFEFLFWRTGRPVSKRMLQLCPFTYPIFVELSKAITEAFPRTWKFLTIYYVDHVRLYFDRYKSMSLSDMHRVYVWNANAYPNAIRAINHFLIKFLVFQLYILYDFSC